MMTYAKKDNPVLDKSFDFGCKIFLFSKKLKEKKEFEIASQLLKCGTSVGANIREAQRAVSKKDFKNKLWNCTERGRRNIILAGYFESNDRRANRRFKGKV